MHWIAWLLPTLGLASSGPLSFQVPANTLHDTIHATLADQKTNQFMFNMDRSWEAKDGKSIITNIYFTKDNPPVAKETTHYKNGLPEYFVQDRIAEKILCELKIENNEISYTRSEDGKVVKTDKEKIESLTLVPDQIAAWMVSQWDTLLKGDTITFRMTLPCRLETVGFKVFYDSEAQLNGKPMVLIKMKPKSFIIAAIVPSVLFYFDKNPPHRLVEYRGHILPKRQEGTNFVDFDGLIQFLEIKASEKPAY